MKKAIFSVFAIVMVALVYGQGGLENVIVEAVPATTAGADQTAYRVYIDLEDGYELQQVKGDAIHPLTISTSTAWYNSSFGTGFGGQNNEAFFSIPTFAGLEYDSYVSLGLSSNSTFGVQLTDDTDGTVDGRLNFPGVTLPLVQTLGAIDIASNFGTTALPTANQLLVDDANGGQYLTFESNADVTDGNIIVIGQFTTDGDFTFCLNIQTREAGTSNFFELFGDEVSMLKYPSPMLIGGCIDSEACNFDAVAEEDDGTCIYATGCDQCSGENDGSGVVVDNPEIGDTCDDGNTETVDDIIINCDGDCEGVIILIDGCTDELACNYDALATNDDDSCVYATGCDECSDDGTVIDNPEIGDTCDDGNDETVNDMIVNCDGDCEGVIILIDGCTDELACNYDALATNDDDSCVYATGCDECSDDGMVIDNPEIGDTCDDGNDETVNDMIVNCDGECEGVTVLIDGCTDESACNYDSIATNDDDSCVYATGCDECSDDGMVIDNPEIGDTCDDGNEVTVNDVFIDCEGNCMGQIIGDCIDIEPSVWGMGPWYENVHQGSFIAQSANDAILAMGNGDLSVEIFSGICGEISIGVYNTVGADEIERVVAGNLIAGETYSYIVSGGTNISTKVKTYANSRLIDSDCNIEANLIDQIYAQREEDMYQNPAVQVTGFGFRFTNLATSEIVEIVDASVDGFYQQLITISALEEGVTYDVRVRHQVLQIANGAVSELWSNFGSSCSITILSEGEMMQLAATNELLFEVNSDVKLFPNPNNGEGFSFEMSGDQVHNSELMISVFNANGKAMVTEKVINTDNNRYGHVSVSNKLLPGIYFIVFQTESERLIKKLIVN